MSVKKTKSTIKRKPTILASKRELFQIFLFVVLCIYMAQCSSSQKASQARIENRSSNSGELRKRQEIARYAQKYVGSKYKYAGRSPKGFDCSGFTHFVMKNYDVDLITVSREQEKQGKNIPVVKAQPGDLLFFRRSKTGAVFHVAMVVSNDSKGISVVHSTSSRGVVVDNISTNSYWKSKVATARDVLSR